MDEANVGDDNSNDNDDGDVLSCPDSKGRCHLMAVGRTMVLVIGDVWGKKY